MKYLIVNFEKNTEYVEHWELMIPTKEGYMPVMTSHPLSGDRPKMFKSKEEAEKFFQENKKNIQELTHVDLGSSKIIFVPADGNYVQHFEILDKGIFSWKKRETFHPMSGDRPLMLDNWAQAKSEIFREPVKSKRYSI